MCGFVGKTVIPDVAPDAPGSKQAAALMTLAGLTNAKKADKDILSYNGGHGFSTFYGYIMLEAMACAGDWQGALDIIRNYWGAMIDLGATTFWEDFNLDWLPNAATGDNALQSPQGTFTVFVLFPHLTAMLSEPDAFKI